MDPSLRVDSTDGCGYHHTRTRTISDKTEVKKQLSFFKDVGDKMKELIISGTSAEEAIDNPDFPGFYESTGGRRENSLKQWYELWSKSL